MFVHTLTQPQNTYLHDLGHIQTLGSAHLHDLFYTNILLTYDVVLIHTY